MIEIIPKKESKLPSPSAILMYFAISLLVVTVLAYFMITNINNNAEDILGTLEQNITQGKTPQDLLVENEVLGYRDKINDFAVLLSEHQMTSHLFETLEGLSHPRTWFSSVVLDSEELNLKLLGEAESFQVLGEQLIIFKQGEQFTEVDLSGLIIKEEGGKIGFTFSLGLNQSIFK